ncbi:hypothetical protein OsJ_29952 [Oryza sativa Japonica Group]|uniref:HTH myb-type domain-containing protein n=1 Tax=Oryza sativa subsp. japonica TaxID=39947 RepID=B9G4H0_ORYSJ|nr:hypothetical protein OsJ_29952 [Oryza sativa Japonica Group]
MVLLRCRKSCCLHWMNYLSPDLKCSNFHRRRLRAHHQAPCPSRQQVEQHIKRKLMSQGIDPQTHQPVSAGTSVAAASELTTTTSTVSFPSLRGRRREGARGGRREGWEGSSSKSSSPAEVESAAEVTLPKFDKAENGIKVIKPYVQVQPRQTNE